MAARSYLVIGGGIVGAASALRLRAAGFEVTLIDPGDPRRGASFGNIGCIAAHEAEPLASPRTVDTFPARLSMFGGPASFRPRYIQTWLPWSLKFLRASTASRFGAGTMAMDAVLREAMPAWRRLMELAGAPSLVSATGHNIVWMHAHNASRGIHHWRRAHIGPATFREMTADELAHLGENLRVRPAAGLAFTGTGQVSEPQAVRDALNAAFTAKGGVVVAGSAGAITTDAAQVTVHLESGETLQAEAALIAAGAWSRPLMRGLGLDVPLIGERGYSVQSAEHNWAADLPPTFFEERSVVVSRFTSGLRASSFVEFGPPDAAPDPKKWDRLQQHLKDLGIVFSDVPDCWSGPRPTLPDYLPAIGRLESHPRVLYAFGHQHLGMTLAAATAEAVEALAIWTPARVNLSPFVVERFA